MNGLLFFFIKLISILQFISEFLIESVEVLEKLANPNEPPLTLEEIKSARNEFRETQMDPSVLRSSLAKMEEAFDTFGDLKEWDYRDCEVLGKIDDCFVKHYMKKGEPATFLFSPNSAKNATAFAKYCDDVDLVLRQNSDKAPKYAREYFAYYSIWEMRGYGFPIPLGTRSVIECLDKILREAQKGFIEVSIRSLAYWRMSDRDRGW